MAAMKLCGKGNRVERGVEGVFEMEEVVVGRETKKP
jgi:hypothetical protein